MNIRPFLPLCALLCVAAKSRVFDVRDFGAAGDGTTLDTVAIQRAIDAAVNQGAVVLMPRGHRFLIGTIKLRSGMDFRIDGELIISTNQQDYSGDGIIMAHDASDLTISGSGKISGRSLDFMTSYDAAGEWWLFKPWRPKMFVLAGCTNLLVRDITFGDAPFWGLHMLGCRNVRVDNVTVNNRLDVPNCDGIDPDHCQNVEIQRCHITCGDDAVVIKSTRQTNDFGPCADIHVHDCVLRTADSGLKIGTETVGDIHDVLFERCRIVSASRGLTIQLRDEGNVSNIVFRDIQFVASYHAEPWWGHGEAISFTAFPRTNSIHIGVLQDILVQNVRGRSENSARVEGTAQNPIRNVRFDNVSLTIKRWTKYPGGVFDNRPTTVLPALEKHDTAGFSLQWVDGVTFQKCAVHWPQRHPNYFGSALETQNVSGLRLEDSKSLAQARQPRQ